MKRKRRILLHLVLILVSLSLLTLLCGYQSPTARIAFRRAERKQLLGPAQIIGTVSLNHWYDQTMIGKSDYGYSLFRWNSDNPVDDGYIAYYPKNGHITIVDPHILAWRWNIAQWEFPFYVFTDYATSSKAEFLLTLTYGETTEVIELEAIKQQDDYFLFILSAQNIDENSLRQLELATSSTYESENTAVVTVTLYDRSGAVLESKTVDITRP